MNIIWIILIKGFYIYLNDNHTCSVMNWYDTSTQNTADKYNEYTIFSSFVP
jgi:hypothetical protein